VPPGEYGWFWQYDGQGTDPGTAFSPVVTYSITNPRVGTVTFTPVSLHYNQVPFNDVNSNLAANYILESDMKIYST
jgi:hypothetical protein